MKNSYLTQSSIYCYVAQRSIILLICLSSLILSGQTDHSLWANSKKVYVSTFDKKSDTEHIIYHNADHDLTKKCGVTQGKRALSLKLKADEKKTGVEFAPETPWDLTTLGDYSLVFDATNESDISAQLIVTIISGNGDSRRRTGTVPAKSSKTFFMDVSSDEINTDHGMRDDPVAWDTKAEHMSILGLKMPADYSKMSKIIIHAEYNYKEKHVILDNMYFASNPPRNADYMKGLVDKFGQNAKIDYDVKIHSEEELSTKADEEMRALAVSQAMDDRSRYGGWAKGPKLNSTGYFRTEKVGDKWALVDPDGYLFFSTGIANVRMANTTTFTGMDYRDESVRYVDPNEVTPEDSRGIVTLTDDIFSTAYELYPERRALFNELPAYDSELANHYSYRRSSHIGPLERGETFSFYQANLERRYGEHYPGSYIAKWRDITLDRMLDWGFTSFGNWAAAEFYHAKRLPYFANGWIIGDFQTVSSGSDYWGPLPDVFDPVFRERAKATVAVIADEVLNSPWCVGVFIDNEKSWGAPGSPNKQYGIVLDALSKRSSESSVKAKFVSILQAKYSTIAELNKAWNKNLADWDALERGLDMKKQEGFTDAAVSDFSTLLEAYATQYFRVVHDELEAVLPNHLYMGCRFASWGMSDEIRRAAIQYVDVFSYNYYEEAIGEKYWKFLEDIDKPSVIGEFHMGSMDAGMLHPGLIHATDQKDRGRMYQNYMHRVIDNPYFVGAHWFQYTDSPLTGRAHDGENYNVGFVTNTDIPYPEMVKAAKEVNSKLYTRRFADVVKITGSR